MRNIILFRPKITEKDEWYKIPLDVLSLARMIPEYEIKIIDAMTNKDYKKEVINSINKDTICMGCGFMTCYQIKDFLNVAKLIKEKYPLLPIVVGGWHTSMLPKESIKNKYIDIIVKGQGEVTFKEVVTKLAKKNSLKNTVGIIYKENNKIIDNPERTLEDINNFPPMPYHLVDIEKYVNPLVNKRTISYIASVGCPFNCGFCADKLIYKRKWNPLKAERVVNELEVLFKKYNINGIQFEEPNFFTNKKWVKDVCKGIIKKNINILWTGSARAEIIKTYDDILDLVKKSGCNAIRIGAESGSENILKLINKGSTVQDIIDSAELLKKYKIIGRYSFIVGFPNQTKEEYKMTINLMSKLKFIYKRHDTFLFFYIPYPETALYDLSIKEGFVPRNSLEGWSNFDFYSIVTPWVDKKYRKVLLYYVPIAYLSEDIKNSFSLVLKPFFLFFHYLFLWRCKHHFFYFPIDYHLYSVGEKFIRKLKKLKSREVKPNSSH